MLDVCLLGTGGMMPLPYRWLTSLMLRYNGSSILIDCGEGTQITIKEKGWSFKPIDVICFTHMHADHISGLPGLLLTMGNADRKEPLTIIGPDGVGRTVQALRRIAPDLPFPIIYKELTKETEKIEMPGYVLRAFKVDHNITCYGYSIEIPRLGKFDLEKANQNNIPQKFWSRLQKGETLTDEDGRELTPQMVLGERRKGIKLTYCTDTRPTENIIQQARRSDLFICEGMYGEKGKEKKARQYKHMTFKEAATLAKQADVKELWLTHFSPSLVHPNQYMKEVREIFENAMPGRDGLTTELSFPEE